jgi:NADH pyrophosphatase NudC (nudix superfamily)
MNISDEDIKKNQDLLKTIMSIFDKEIFPLVVENIEQLVIQIIQKNSICCTTMKNLKDSSIMRDYDFYLNIKNSAKFCPYCGKELDKSKL